MPAYQLKSPKLVYGNKTHGVGTIEDASWNLRNSKFKRGATLTSIGIIHLQSAMNVDSGLKEDDVVDLVFKLRTTLSEHAITVPHRSKDQIRKDIITITEVDGFERLSQKLTDKKLPQDVTYLFILPSKDSKVYAAVKKMMDCYLGVKTVCCVAEKVNKKARDGKGFDQYLSNLALKFNFKNSGTVHGFRNGDGATSKGSPLARLYGPDGIPDTIVLGADVTHPPKDSALGCPSIAAVVGSNDAEFMNFPGSMQLQAGRQKVSADSHRVCNY